MTKKSVVTTLTFGFLAAFAFSTLSVTTAEAECKDFFRSAAPICPQGWVETSRGRITPTGASPLYNYTCCTTPSKPYATGESAGERAARLESEAAKLKAACEAQGKRYDPATTRCDRPMKQMGTSKITGEKAGADKTALRNACINNHWIWDEQTERCRKPSQAKAECEAKGSSYRYDLDTRRCVGGMTRKTSSEEAEEQPSRKKKRRAEDLLDDLIPILEGRRRSD